ncbi:MAG: hypothetical protein OXU51_04835 [Candidatus Poribacteria bacterium]|nr:hypothetical protein [Candidatus Poribacteria bacterium]
MKCMVIVAVCMLTTLTACETETPTREESSIHVGEDASIIVGEGSTIIVGEGVSVEEQSDQPLFLNRIVQDVVHKRHCSVGDTIVIQATVLNGSSALTSGQIDIETGDDDVAFNIDTHSLLDVLQCADYFKNGETYEFKLFIDGIKFYTQGEREWRMKQVWWDEKKHHPIFQVSATLILTQKLEKEIREAGCWIDGGQ